MSHGRLQSPSARFLEDPRQLRLFESDEKLRQAFLLHDERRVSADHVVSVDGVDYEVPRGVPVRKKVLVYRCLLDQTRWVLHGGKLVGIQPVDLAANARSRRSAPDKELLPRRPLPKSAADLAYERDLIPVLDVDGGCSAPNDEGTMEDDWT